MGDSRVPTDSNVWAVDASNSLLYRFALISGYGYRKIY